MLTPTLSFHSPSSYRARGQRPHRRPVERLEGRAPAPVELLERPRVELLEQLPDRRVQLLQAEESAVAQARQDPPLRDQDAPFDLRLVLRLARTRRHHRHPVVLRHLRVRRVDLRLDSGPASSPRCAAGRAPGSPAPPRSTRARAPSRPRSPPAPASASPPRTCSCSRRAPSRTARPPSPRPSSDRRCAASSRSSR